MNFVGSIGRDFYDSARIRRDTSDARTPCFSIWSRTVERLLADGPQYGARLERKRTVRACGRGWATGKGDRMKKRKKTKAALKRKVGARIETQFDPRYEAPAEVGSPRAHLT